MQSVLIAILHFYKRFVSPFLPSACRFRPTCSEYMAEAIAAHGAPRGVWMGLKRLARCHPFCEGGFDPVPPSPSPANSTDPLTARLRNPL